MAFTMATLSPNGKKAGILLLQPVFPLVVKCKMSVQPRINFVSLKDRANKNCVLKINPYHNGGPEEELDVRPWVTEATRRGGRPQVGEEDPRTTGYFVKREQGFWMRC